MTTSQIVKTTILLLVSLTASLIFIHSPVKTTPWSLLPPALAILAAFLSNSVFLSLAAAVFMGSFVSLYGQGAGGLSAILLGLQRSGVYFYEALSDKTNLQILGFVFFIFMTVHVMSKSGGLGALVNSLKRWIVGPRSAQLMTALMGCLIFIDDYANTMIVGSTMKKVTDRYGVSREKLAFLVDATSAPIAGVALVSTWIGYEVGLFNEMARKFSWSLDGYDILLDALGFRFYCFMMLIFVFANSFWGVDFGPMKTRSHTPTSSEKEPNTNTPKSSATCALLPLFTLLSLIFSMLWYDGGGRFSTDLLSWSQWRLALNASENGILILLISSVISYLVALISAFAKSSFNLKDATQTIALSLKSYLLPVAILIFAWSLKSVCDDLKTAEFIVLQLKNQINPQLLPPLVFVIAALTAFSVGTSWGTMAILIPTVMPLAVALGGGSYSPFVALSLAAILDGSIMGDHCSPISDTTIMSATATECDLMSHVKTQLPYSLLVGSLALSFGYFPAASYNLSPLISLTLALVFIMILFKILKVRSTKS